MRERYDGLDGLRAYSIIGIALMHILTINIKKCLCYVKNTLIDYGKWRTSHEKKR